MRSAETEIGVKRAGKSHRDSIEIRIYIHEDGSVSISDLFDYMLPVAFALNPGDKKIRGFMDSVGDNKEGA